MLPFQKILCPTDFSDSSYEGVKTAGEMAYYFGSELIVLHVVSPIPVIPNRGDLPGFDVTLYEQELEASSKRTLQEIINHLEWRELKARLIVLRGKAGDEILRIAEEEEVDLIVIPIRDQTGLNRIFFGSVAEKVIRLARCPVLTVPFKAERSERRK